MDRERLGWRMVKAYLGKNPKSWSGYTCPSCLGSMRVVRTGRCNAGRYIVRARECVDCPYRCMTVEVFLAGADKIYDINAFDDEQKFARDLARRKREGYHGLKTGHRKSALRVVSSIKIRGGKEICEHGPA